MYPNLRLLSLLSIFSLTLIGLTGCGEKRIHVATVSDAPGDELALVPMTDNSEDQTTSGLSNDSIDESALSAQIPEEEDVPEEPAASAMTNEPINFTHKPSTPSNQDASSDSPLPDTVASAPESEFPDHDESLDFSLPNGTTSESETELSAIDDSLAEGHNLFAQPSSSPGDQSNQSLANVIEFQKPVNAETSDTITSPFSQDSSAGLQDIPTGEGLEPIPDTFQIAKAEPSDSLQDRINQIKQEELAAVAAGLEDVFFHFDSWTLTEEGKQSLQRTFGWFEQNPAKNLIIEGHADQRGTQAYNIVLAKKRAVAVQDYLSQLGVDPSRLAVISYGKDKPFCQDITEVCYQLNRRGHLLIPTP